MEYEDVVHFFYIHIDTASCGSKDGTAQRGDYQPATVRLYCTVCYIVILRSMHVSRSGNAMAHVLYLAAKVEKEIKVEHGAIGLLLLN